MYIKNIVLGAGISGLAAANELNKSETIVFEKENYYGGLCNSFKIGDFIFDTAVHLSFTNIQQVRDVFDKTAYNLYEPVPFNYISDKWIKYPIENNLFNLEVEEKIDCIKSFINKPTFNKILNYNEWLLSIYGEYITNKFYSKYTNKYWCKKPNELSTTWIGKRLNVPTIESILNGALTEDTNNDYYAKEMRYPMNSGYKSFLNPLIDNIDIKLNKEVCKIDLNNKIVFFEDNTQYKYTNLISSIPLPEFIKLLENIPEIIKKAASRLISTSVTLASVGFNKNNIPPYLWFYIYDDDILPARAYSPSLKSKNNVPNNCSSLQFEIYHTKERKLNMSDMELESQIKNTLLKMNLCNSEDILFIDLKHIKYANVIFYNGMEEDRDLVKHFLNENGVSTIGRFGEWDYLWSDQSFMSGKIVGEKINKLNN